MIKMVLCFVSFVFRSKNVECDIKVVTGGMKCSSLIFYFILIFFFFFAQWLVYAVHGFNRSLFFFKMEFRWDNLITMTTARFLHRFFYTGNHFLPNVWSVGISLLRIIVILPWSYTVQKDVSWVLLNNQKMFQCSRIFTNIQLY